jgi:hypothetical protein
LKDLPFENYGIRIVREEGRIIAEYDSGESAGSRLIRSYISEEQASRAMINEREAYLVIIEIEGDSEVPPRC